MPADPDGAWHVRFGAFEYDSRANELKKHGIRLKVQEQPLAVLRTLLWQPGETVSREELQKHIWPDGTFVDFEQSLNKAVNKLREALGDSADHPVYVETLARRGYRFVAPVQTEPPLAPAAPPLAKRRRWPWIAGIAVLAAFILTTGVWPQPAPVVTLTRLTNDGLLKSSFLVVTGGRVLYQTSGLGAERVTGTRLWSVPTAGGEPRRESTPCPEGKGTFLQSVSYLRQRLVLVCREGGQRDSYDWWLTGLDGSSPRLIGSYGWDSFISSISPNLETLLLARREGLSARPVHGDAERQLLRPDVWNFLSYTFWHPAGDRIGFLRRQNHLFKVWEVRADGTGARPLIPGFAGHQVGAQWSPDGKRLYFVSKGEIFVQGSRSWLGWLRPPAPVRLTSGPVKLSMPTEDPANPFAVFAQGQILGASAMKLNRKTNAWEPVLGGLAADRVDLSPDGEWAAYINWPDAALWKCRKDGSGKVLLEDGMFCYGPRWSPDGTRIAFAARDRAAVGFAIPSNPPFKIFTISANGGKPKPVPGVNGPAFDPTWSPDGKRIVYAPYWQEVPKEQQRVSIVNVETGVVEEVPGSTGFWSTRWSPDGKWLAAFACDPSPAWERFAPFVYSFATGKWSLLRPAMTEFNDWSGDSQYVYASDPLRRLIRIEVRTRKVEELRKYSEFPLQGVIGQGPSWTPDGEAMVLRDTSVSEIYRIDRKR